MTFPSRLRRESLNAAFAVRLREEMTDAERCLWAILRDKQMGGLKFRRQQPLGPYVADSFCAAAKLIVELDGDQHGADAAMVRDDRRTQWFLEHGYRVLRFPNADAFRNREFIIDSIVHYLEEHDRPLPEICSADFDPPFRRRQGYGGQARGG